MLGKLLLVLFTLAGCGLNVDAGFDIGKKRAIVQSIDQCREKHSNYTLLWFAHLGRANEATGEATASLKGQVKKEIKDLSMVFTFWKCDNSGNPDSCEHFLKDYTVKNICQRMVEKNQAWTPFIESFSTPLSCPIKPGVYEARNMTVNTKFLSYLTISDALWKIQMEGFDQGKRISCILVVFKVIPYYVRRT